VAPRERSRRMPSAAWCTNGETLLVDTGGFADDGSLAIDEPTGGDTAGKAADGELDVVLRVFDLGIGAIEAAGVCDAFLPGCLVELKLERIGEGDDGLLFAEVVGLGRGLDLLEGGLLLGVGSESRLVGLIGGRPERCADGDGVVIER
jgi:hypothetical protein